MTDTQFKVTPLLAAIVAAPLFVCGLAFLSGQALSLDRISSLIFLYSVIFYPICEEFIFRGFIQRELLSRQVMQKKWGAISLSNCLTNLIFAMAHLVVFRDLAVLLVFFPGLIFGYFFERHRNLLYPILLHSWYNLLSLLTVSLW
ncbi:JDVT-CTERM system glutamic-type intramembrane protease MrtJ [Motilimonas cestriensis]|uniref:JDVT-CTERM system glutamic-type intramembrane protease MrtJ n=1 Tax=Motilimonas cestriensis TaxID=2742685 RepID=UPI001E4C677C